METSFYLRSEGHANTRKGNGVLTAMRAAKDESPDQFASDPGNPVPVEPPGREPMPRSSMFRPVERGIIEDRDDVAVYTAAPQTESMLVAGNPKADLWVSADGRDADYAVKLVDVWPSGAAYPVAEGVLRLTHWDTDAKASPVTPDKVYRITIDLGHTAFQLQPGHSLRMEIAGSDFPAYDRNSHTGDGPFSTTGAKGNATCLPHPGDAFTRSDPCAAVEIEVTSSNDRRSHE